MVFCGLIGSRQLNGAQIFHHIHAYLSCCLEAAALEYVGSSYETLSSAAHSSRSTRYAVGTTGDVVGHGGGHIGRCSCALQANNCKEEEGEKSRCVSTIHRKDYDDVVSFMAKRADKSYGYVVVHLALKQARNNARHTASASDTQVLQVTG